MFSKGNEQKPSSGLSLKIPYDLMLKQGNENVYLSGLLSRICNFSNLWVRMEDNSKLHRENWENMNNVQSI
jgi:hypothetical protein